MWLVSGFDLPLFWTDGYTVVSSLGLSGDQGPCRYHSTWRSGRQMEACWELPFLFVCFQGSWDFRAEENLEIPHFREGETKVLKDYW